MLATAALVVLTLGASYVTLQRSHGDQETGQPASIPAVVVTSATPDSDASVETETLFATVLPTGQIPTSGVLDFVVNRLSLDPGRSAPISPTVQACCPGPHITHVLEGELTIRVDGPMQVFRAGAVAPGTVDAGTVPPGTEVVLHPGDTITADFTLPTTYSNLGTIPVQLVTAGLYAGTLPGPWAENVTYLDFNEDVSHNSRPSGPAEVRLVRAILPPGGEVPAPPSSSLVLEVGANGDASIGKRADGSLRNLNERAETIYVITVEPVTAGTAIPSP
jgi:hypothetical protein